MSSVYTNTGIIILAAGASSRLGSPKQLVEYNGKTLLRHTLDVAADSIVGLTVAVVGAHAESSLKEIKGSGAIPAENTEWQEGMASSIRVGLMMLLEHRSTVDAVIFMVCDQPFVSAAVLNDLMATHKQTGKPIVACNYGEATGPPALFDKSFFAGLMQLKGDEGARKIIQQHKEEVATVLFSKGGIDIDTMDDYERLVKHSPKET